MNYFRSHSRTSTQSGGGRLTDPTAAANGANGPSPLRRPNLASVKRNLAESYPPENKRPNTRDGAGAAESENATHVVASLNPMMNKYSVKVNNCQLFMFLTSGYAPQRPLGALEVVGV